MRILFTGSAGFIAGYAVKALLAAGHTVVGVDNFSKYGRVAKSYDEHPDYEFHQGDCKDVDLLTRLARDCDQVVAAAAMIGGIAYFHQHAYDLLAENERILAATFDAALAAARAGRLQKINVLSSSMVYESTGQFPTLEGEQLRAPPPRSTYGFQKLMCEYFARGAYQQYGLAYTIIRPFNCVGIGEGRARAGQDGGNQRMALSHVLPDLALKALQGQRPLPILGSGRQVRCYTHGEDLGRGICLCVQRPEAVNEDFNLSIAQPTTVLELAQLVWRTVHGSAPFEYLCEEPFEFDVQQRVPDTAKAERLLGFRARIPLAESVREVVAWVRAEMEQQRL
jgi:nucleoside-diphosphate-sugar epimerase